MATKINGLTGIEFPDATRRVTALALINVQTITATAVYTPTVGTKNILVELQGAGGAGGGAAATAAGQTSLGSGGGAGGFCKSWLTSGFSGVTVTIGAGGTGTSGVAGNVGGYSSFGALMTAPGGTGGNVLAAGTIGFARCNNSTLPTGGNISNEVGSGSDLAIALSATTSYIGSAGASHFGAGAPSVSSGGINGVNAVSYGSGGGGTGNTASMVARVGGMGKDGVCIIYEYA